MGEQKQGLYMISVAASLAGVHPQTLRIYEERHLIQPTRTPKGTRLYSDENVETLRRIQELTDEGMNLAGVQRVFEMEARIARMGRRIASLERQLKQTRADALAEIDRIRRAGRAEIVRYQPPQPTRIPVQRPAENEEKEA
ncbi:MAG: MerR family transcriptional regulator [Thermoleophilaceae bacterium]|nr:MerR family transcriptional regulator [Thermoleophilaceae bacterium]